MKESYVVKPAEIEVFTHGGGTDIIMRKNIQEVPDEESGTKWECDERQIRYGSAVSLSEVKANLSRFWSLAGGEIPLEEVKAAKISEMSAACREAIIAGFDVVLADGKSRHFSMTVEDQLNINSLYGLLASGMTQVPYHADGEACEYFSAEDFGIIVQTATAHKTYHESYFNSLKSYITIKRTAASVDAITYGVEIPTQYQSDVLKALQEA